MAGDQPARTLASSKSSVPAAQSHTNRRGEAAVRISVLIPSYRRTDALQMCLQALARQSSPPAEILVAARPEDTATLDLLRALPEPVRAILVERAHEIAVVTNADTLVELGSGTSDKTRILLDALRDAGTITRFVPFDVSEQTLRDAAASVKMRSCGG